jgi:hypothetical protein
MNEFNIHASTNDLDLMPTTTKQNYDETWDDPILKASPKTMGFI